MPEINPEFFDFLSIFHQIVFYRASISAERKGNPQCSFTIPAKKTTAGYLHSKKRNGWFFVSLITR
jgi:hypothetical protein